MSTVLGTEDEFFLMIVLILVTNIWSWSEFLKLCERSTMIGFEYPITPLKTFLSPKLESKNSRRQVLVELFI